MAPSNNQAPAALVLPTALINKVIDTLAKQPYAQVAGLIAEIHQVTLPQVEQANRPEPTPTPSGPDEAG